MSALQKQEGGNHYKEMAIQPVEFIHKNGIGFIEGAVIKYVSRWRNKNGIEDLKKAKHFLELLIEMEEKPEPYFVDSDFEEAAKKFWEAAGKKIAIPPEAFEDDK